MRLATLNEIESCRFEVTFIDRNRYQQVSSVAAHNLWIPCLLSPVINSYLHQINMTILNKNYNWRPIFFRKLSYSILSKSNSRSLQRVPSKIIYWFRRRSLLMFNKILKKRFVHFDCSKWLYMRHLSHDLILQFCRISMTR